MQSVVVDTNCVLYLANGVEPYATQLEALAAAARKGQLELVAAGVTASENGRGNAPRSWADFEQLLDAAGLADVRVLLPMGYYGVSFWGKALWVNEEMQKLEQQIHAILAPGFDMEATTNSRRWRNVKCDVQVVWSHVWHQTDLLVTNDRGITSKASALANLGANVTTPNRAAVLFQGSGR